MMILNSMHWKKLIKETRRNARSIRKRRKKRKMKKKMATKMVTKIKMQNANVEMKMMLMLATNASSMHAMLNVMQERKRKKMIAQQHAPKKMRRGKLVEAAALE